MTRRQAMASLCSPRATTIGRAVIIAGLTLIVIVPAMAMVWVRTPWARGEHHTVVQPVAFDHRVHLTGLRIDCRYCHADAERTASAEQVAPLTMGWCLDCHSDPGPRLRPLADITTMGWRHAQSDTSGARLVGQGDRIRRPHREHDLSSLGRDGCRVETSGRTRRNARVPARRGRSAPRGLAARLSDAARRGRGTRVVVGACSGSSSESVSSQSRSYSCSLAISSDVPAFSRGSAAGCSRCTSSRSTGWYFRRSTPRA